MLAFGLALCSGLLLALSLPPYSLSVLEWVALAPLFLAVRKAGALRAFELGVASGAVCGLAYLREGMFRSAPNPAVAPFGCLAIFLGTAAILAAWAWRRGDGPLSALLMAAGGVTLEWATTASPLPLHLAMGQHRVVPLLQLAALTGIWGISFLVWWLNAAVAEAIALRRWRTPALLTGLAVLLGVSAAGALRVAGERSRRVVRVAAVQDYTGEAGDDPSRAGDPPDRETLTSRAAYDGARLVVWSEDCLGKSFTPHRAADPTAALARKLGLFLVAGYLDEAAPRDLNCAALVSPRGETLGIHDKIHLYMGERNSVQPGKEARAWSTWLGRIGMEICFDSCYTDVSRRLAADGARLIAMPNFDPPTAHGTLHQLHAALLPFRAVENHVAFVRADANGLSQVIGPDGRILGQSPMWQADALVRDVPLGSGRGTPFTRWGDWLPPVCALLAALLLLLPLAARLPSRGPAGPEKRESARG